MGKEYNWNDIRVFVGGKEIKGITSIEYPDSIELSFLERELLIAEENEKYELCAEIKKRIDKLKSKK